MIFLATDFGLTCPYVGQMKAVLARLAPDVPVIDLFADLPPFQPMLAAYLLAAYANVMDPGDVLLGVVDPGVGGDRRPLMMQAAGCWYVGPDNGLFELIRRRAGTAHCRSIIWRPEVLSASFHGRDLFAPVAARLATGKTVASDPLKPMSAPWPDDLATIVYIDHYGNAMSGLRASAIAETTAIILDGERLQQARTFSDRPPGEAFWYENANGLVEIAVNGGSAAERFDLRPGVELTVQTPG